MSLLRPELVKHSACAFVPGLHASPALGPASQMSPGLSGVVTDVPFRLTWLCGIVQAQTKGHATLAT